MLLFSRLEVDNKPDEADGIPCVMPCSQSCEGSSEASTVEAIATAEANCETEATVPSSEVSVNDAADLLVPSGQTSESTETEGSSADKETIATDSEISTSASEATISEDESEEAESRAQISAECDSSDAVMAEGIPQITEAVNLSKAAESTMPVEEAAEPSETEACLEAKALESADADAATETEKEKSTIEEHFRKIGYEIVESHKPLSGNTGLQMLSKLLFKESDAMKPMLKVTRTAICQNNGRFTFVLDKSPTVSRTQKEIVNKLFQYGVFTSWSVDRNQIHATVARVPRVVGFVNGTYLEIYAASAIENVVRTFSESRNLEWDVLTNVKIARPGHTFEHELDAIFSISDKVFAFEAKSGSNFYDFEKLYNTRKELCFVPDYYLLLCTSLSNRELADTLEYFYQYYISGTNDFEQKLNAMIHKAFCE